MSNIHFMKKTALITGSARRIGKEIALHLAKNGYDIAIHYNHSETEAQKLAEEIAALGKKTVLLKANLENEAETASLVEKAKAVLGIISCLINNASAYEVDTLENFTRASWDKHLVSNCFAPLLLAREFAKQHPKGNLKGNIINITDSATLRPRREDVFTYQLSKSLFHTATEMLALSLAPHIRVNALAPGVTLKNIQESDEYFNSWRNNSPLQKGADVNDLLGALDFLLAAESITGVTLPVDGGKWLK